MLAILAGICFAVAFVLKLVGASLGHFDLVILGLFLLALHGAAAAGVLTTRRSETRPA